MSLIIEGESCGGAHGHATVLEWKTSGTGIRIQSSNTDGLGTATSSSSRGSDCTILRNLSLKGGGGTSTGTDEDKWFHGIHARARFVAEDISVEGFAHSGVFMNATTKASTGQDNIAGNVNCFALSRIVTTNNGVAGLWVKGNDANAGTVTHLSATKNGQYGIYDESFLGNTYVGCHTADNGQKYSQVSWKASLYHVFYGQDGHASHIEPGTDPSVWRLVGPKNPGSNVSPEWAPDTTYFNGGAYIS